MTTSHKKPFTTAEIRSAFLNYFAAHGHKIVHSASLIPGNDPTLLFTNAGMVPFKNLFNGTETRDYTRATSAQRCVRAGGKHNDLENVGYTARHHTFFEMMGNFSFGDYFKKEAIPFIWEVLTEVFQLPKDRLCVTVYIDDDEAYNIWRDTVGVSEDRIVRIGDKPGHARYDSDNFWTMGDTGPCGPCSEVFYDHGPEIWGGMPGTPEEDGDRWIEIWNIVFTQFDRDAEGVLHPLPKPCIDTGMGLERIAAVLQGVHNNYDIDLFKKLIDAAMAVTGCTDRDNNSLKVIADHIRATVFLMTDGVLPGNEGRGYVLRRIMRRAMRHGHKIGAKGLFFYKLVEPLVEEMGEAYPEIIESKERVIAQIQKEEERFAQTLDAGMQVLEKDLAGLSGTVIPGDVVFKLYDTYGFPVDLTNDIARERNLTLDMAGYEANMQAQRARAKAAGKFRATTQYHVEGKTDFVGYEQDTVATEITSIFVEEKPTTALNEGDDAVIVLKATPFYAESGGQVGDTGVIESKIGKFIVEDTQKQGDTFLHFGYLESGVLAVGSEVTATIDSERRNQIRRHHSATHLLHKALRTVLGDHVRQKGSLVDEEKLRFDFSHDEPITPAQIAEIERLVNAQVLANAPVITEVLPFEEAKKKGAMALFGEKYGDVVRVLTMGKDNFSIEFCGGTHVSRTGDIGLVKVVSQGAVSAGVRRIEAVAGFAALARMQAQESLIHQSANALKAEPTQLVERIDALQVQLKAAEKDVHDLQRALAAGGASSAEQPQEINGWKALAVRRDGFDNATLRDTADQLRDKYALDVVVIGSADGDVARLIVSVAKNAKTLKAGDIVRELAKFIDGKGGGRPDFAQAGGKNPAGLADALAALNNVLPSKG